MKIELVGTGSIGALQSSACTLINDKILIDMPNGIIKKLKQTGHNVLEIENCIITHLHGDHFFDIPFMMLERYFYNTEKELNIYCPKETKQNVKDLMDIGFPGDYEKVNNAAKINFIEFDKLNNKQIEKDIHVTSYEVIHGDIKPAYGYTIEIDNKTVGVSGDSKYCESIEEIVNKSDISILDMSFMEPRKSHMGLENIIKICEEHKNKTIVSTHMNDYTRNQAKQLNIKNLIVPNDGEIIRI